MSGRLVCVLAVIVVVLVGGVGCGGGGATVAWKGQPRSGPVEGGQMLFGTLLNRSGKPLRLRAADVRVLDRSGRELSAAAAFAGGYNAGIALRGFGTEMFAAATAGAGDGAQIAVAPGATVPLSVSWKGKAAAVEVAGERLTLH
jgi:hypothetical protein